jgi:hypothetical protein
LDTGAGNALKDMLLCALGKKGLTTTMEVRHYFQAAEKAERTVSKQDYLRQRQNLNPEASIYVEQDFLAQTLVYNMTQDVLGEAEEQARERGYRHEVKINENIAIGLWKEQFIRLMLEDDDEKQEQLLRRLQADMARNIVPVRQLKGRGRKWNYFNKYKCNQKPSFWA